MQINSEPSCPVCFELGYLALFPRPFCCTLCTPRLSSWTYRSQLAQRIHESWFEDGDLVIQAEGCQYRVFRGILAARSPVFQDILSFPQPPAAELVEGCPLVHLHDSARELTVFLQAIFDSGFFLPYPSPTDFDTIAGALRLRESNIFLVVLSFTYRRGIPQHFPILITGIGKPSWKWPQTLAYKIYIIQLSREVESCWILPLTFYSLSVSVAKLGTDIYRGTIYNGMSANLSEADQKSFLKGNRMQCASVADDILRFLVFPLEIDGCTRARCYKARLQALDYIRSHRQVNPCHPLFIWGAGDWELLENDICSICFTSLKQTHQEARQKFWNELPGIYGLAPWTELEQMRTAAIGADLEMLAR
ncbi:hypothetical protein B0H13DRAFT_1721346 [Mycena leptocephala]|nr:hypothetical protein B0H13DRAFT_1721346 [Mycena leptocephala]